MMVHRSSRALGFGIAGALLLGLSAFVAGAKAQGPGAAKDDQTYAWTFKYDKGETIKYRLNYVYTGAKFKTTIRSVDRYEVKSVNAKGESTILDTPESQVVVDNGHEIPDNPEDRQVVIKVLDRRGLVVKQELKNPDAGTETINLIGIMTNARPIPDTPVKAGDSWKTELDNLLLPGKKIIVTSTLVGVEKVLGIDTLKIKRQMTIPTTPDEKDPLKLDSTYNVDPRMGHLVRDNFTLENYETFRADGKVRVKITAEITKILPGVNDKDDATEKTGGA